MGTTNFLIGRGELLTRAIKAPGGGRPKPEVYTFSEAKQILKPQLKDMVGHLNSLPDAACPGNFGVVRMAMNPSYIAKSYFPSTMLRSVGLESVGSRNVKLTPRKWSKQGEPIECSTTELFIAGKRDAFHYLTQWVDHIEYTSSEAIDFSRVERFSDFTSEERIRNYGIDETNFFEVGIHLLPDEQPSFIQTAFEAFVQKLDIIVHTEFGFRAGNLWFVPVECEYGLLQLLSDFTFIRIIRAVPKLRGLRPATRSSGISVKCNLPTEKPLSSEPRVAILDGGLPDKHPINPWLRAYRKLEPNAADDIESVEHGLGVTSAFLFGAIKPNSVAERPYSYVDHVRVLDDDSDTEDPLELYRTLGFVEQVLLSRQYEFINLSLGPDLPIEDSDVHAWTSVIDDLLSDGDTFMTVAIGNNGDLDHGSGNVRVQVPSDCVNAIAVGASNDTDSNWERATYSAIGPGRSPGVIKPDLMAFGGAASKYFHVLAPKKNPELDPQLGTSFASPYLLRSAVGIRATLGSELSPLAIKALLVHSADQSSHHAHHVGWGKIPEDLTTIITCEPGVARIVYQGELKPSKYLRATLPLPNGGLTGRIRLKATFCYACPVDPQDTSAYTRAGLDIVFRPNAKNIKKNHKNEDKKNAETRSFFSASKFATEEERRSDVGKWETVLHGDVGMLGKTLDRPVFDIHYNAREAGGATKVADRIRYALIITVEAPKHADLYNDILRAYANILMPIQPLIPLPIKT